MATAQPASNDSIGSSVLRAFADVESCLHYTAEMVREDADHKKLPIEVVGQFFEVVSKVVETYDYDYIIS